MPKGSMAGDGTGMGAGSLPKSSGTGFMDGKKKAQRSDPGSSGPGRVERGKNASRMAPLRGKRGME